jgi:hypothetical protein
VTFACQIRQLKVRRQRTNRQAARLSRLTFAARRQSFLDRLQPQQNPPGLTDELITEPGSQANQQPRQNCSEQNGSH